MKSLGYTTGAVDVTRGEMGTRGTVEGRADEAKSREILKLDVRENLGLPDGHVFVDDDSRAKLVRVLRRLKPKVILTHQEGDPHPDHDHIVRLVRESARLSSMKNYDPETGDEKIAVPRVAPDIFLAASSRPSSSTYPNISKQKWPRYGHTPRSSTRPDSTEPETRLTDKRFLDELENRSRYFGSLIGVEAGEPFYVRESLNVEDPIDLLTRSMNLYS